MNICQILPHMQCFPIEGFATLWKVCLAKIASFLLFHSVVRNDPNSDRDIKSYIFRLVCCTI